MGKNTKVESTLTAEQVRENIANMPRQSVTRYVGYFHIINELAPERLEEFFGEQVPALAEASEKIESPVAAARLKAEDNQLAIAVKALENTDEKNGYANYTFDAGLFDEKTRVKTPRTKKTAVDKVEDVLSNASEEDMEALAALLKARGLV